MASEVKDKAKLNEECRCLEPGYSRGLHHLRSPILHDGLHACRLMADRLPNVSTPQRKFFKACLTHSQQARGCWWCQAPWVLQRRQLEGSGGVKERVALLTLRAGCLRVAEKVYLWSPPPPAGRCCSRCALATDRRLSSRHPWQVCWPSVDDSDLSQIGLTAERLDGIFSNSHLINPHLHQSPHGFSEKLMTN